MKKLLILSCVLLSFSISKAEVQKQNYLNSNYSNPWYEGYPVLLSYNELPQSHLDEFNLKFVGMYPQTSETGETVYLYGYIPK